MGANVFSCPRTQHDPPRLFMQVKGSQFDSVRRWQTSGTVLDFPDTEEVTGSNPVRPSPFFEIPSSAKRPNESQPPAVLRFNHWSELPWQSLGRRSLSGRGAPYRVPLGTASGSLTRASPRQRTNIGADQAKHPWLMTT